MSDSDEFEFKNDLAAVLKKHCMDQISNTADFVLACYLIDCLQAWISALEFRAAWPGHPSAPPGGNWTSEL